MVTKEILFDMDGTIADLYGVENWLERLRREDPSPYVVARPMYDMDSLAVILNLLKDKGYRIIVVSWGSKGASDEYEKEIKKAKLLWLRRYTFPFDDIYIVPYGTPKQNFVNADISILIDDNKAVRDSFIRGNKYSRFAIDANKNIINELIDMLIA